MLAEIVVGLLLVGTIVIITFVSWTVHVSYASAIRTDDTVRLLVAQEQIDTAKQLTLHQNALALLEREYALEIKLQGLQNEGARIEAERERERRLYGDVDND